MDTIKNLKKEDFKRYVSGYYYKENVNLYLWGEIYHNCLLEIYDGDEELGSRKWSGLPTV